MTKTSRPALSFSRRAGLLFGVVALASVAGLEVELITFNDYTSRTKRWSAARSTPMPSSPKPYLYNQIEQNGYHIVVAGYTGLYSKTHASVADLKDGASIGVPNDPSNEGCALKALEQQGLIKLRDGTGILAMVADVAENPKNIWRSRSSMPACSAGPSMISTARWLTPTGR